MVLIRLKKQKVITVAPIYFKFCKKIVKWIALGYNFFVNAFTSHVVDALHHFAYIISATTA